MTVDVSTTTLRHEVRLVHASTGAVLGPVAGRLLDAVPGWYARSAGDTVVVAARAGLPEPATTPRLAVTLQSPSWREVLVFPADPALPERTVAVPLDTPTKTVSLHPRPMTLVVRLTEPSTGDPRSGRTVTARANDASGSIPLTEGAPGTYTSAAVEWTAAFTPCELLVDGDLLRTVSLDFTTSTTSIRLVDVT
jgi:hypothetical protein